MLLKRSERGLLCKQCPGPSFSTTCNCYEKIHQSLVKLLSKSLYHVPSGLCMCIQNWLQKLHNPVLLALLHTCEVAAGNRGGLVGPIFGGG